MTLAEFIVVGLVLGSLFLICGLLLTWGVSRLTRGKVKRNWLFGIRTGATMASEDAWELGHRAARVPLLCMGLVVAAGGVCCLGAVPLALLGVMRLEFAEWFSLLSIIVAALGALGAGLWSMWLAHRAIEESNAGRSARGAGVAQEPNADPIDQRR